nr:reverse transcriptase domain-containing protein [Tanacetum cinerariifolium]
MEDEFYHLIMKGNDLKTYVKRFQELATLCPTMVLDSEKMMEAFIRGLPQMPKDHQQHFPGKSLHAKGYECSPKSNVVTAQVMEKKLEDKRLKDIPVVREFLDVFPEDLPGLPQVRQVEFQIDLIPRATPVARAPYRLAPSEMQELSNQLQELADRGYHQLRVRDEDIPKTAFRTRTLRLLLEIYQGFIKDCKVFDRINPEKQEVYLDEDQKTAFQLFKLNLCEALILALPEGNNDFVVYCDASHQGLGAVLMQREKKELNTRQRRWLELLADYDCEIRYHPGKANVIADALSGKERVKQLRVRSLVMNIHLKLPLQILEAQTEAIKEENIKAENLRGMYKAFGIRPDGTRFIKNQSWLTLFGNLRDLIMRESYKSKYYIHPGSDKMYQDLKKLYW